MNFLRLQIFAVVAMLLASVSCGAIAHPLAPALLQLEQINELDWAVVWRHSRVQAGAPLPQPVLPDACAQTTPAEISTQAGTTAVTSTWRVRCEAQALAGAQVGVTGLADNPINVILRVIDWQGSAYQTLLRANEAQVVWPVLAAESNVWRRYFELGVEHMLFGPDHLLFLLALMLLLRGRGVRRLVTTLTAFTLGHSATLSLATLGLISVNAALMEFSIALSLVVVARELLRRQRSIMGRWPGLLAFAFGLLHGLGFAAALGNIGLPQQQIIAPLVAFNLGVEVAQLAIVFVVFSIILLARYFVRQPVLKMSPWAALAPAYVIGSLAVFWCFQRLPGAL